MIISFIRFMVIDAAQVLPRDCRVVAVKVMVDMTLINFTHNKTTSKHG